MSSDAVELKKLVKKLQGTTNPKEIVDLLGLLKRDFVINETLLRESKAGLAVGNLRKHENKEVVSVAKDLVKKWKDIVEEAKKKNGGPSKLKGPGGKATTPATPTAAKPATVLRSAKVDGITINFTGDKTRDKCAELLYDALASDSGAPSDLISQRAKDIELAVYNAQGGATGEYKAKIRSLFVNLKDKKNPSLREGVVSGEIPAQKFAVMTSEDLASEDRKAADEKIKNENFFASLGAGEQQAETDAFQCGRCKQRKCRYRQAQTRSADEPMTTFVTCVNCGNRWKFS